MIGIYKITAPDGKVYIGQSNNIARRWDNYAKRLNLSFLLKKSFDLFGFVNHNFEVVEECLVLQLNDRERYYQDLFSVIGDNGLNCLLSKSSEKPQVLRDEFKERIRSTFKSKPIDHFSLNQQLVLNTETGVYYDSVTRAAKALAISQATLSNNLSGKTDFNRYPIVYAYPDKNRDSEIKNRISNRLKDRSPRKKQERFFSRSVIDLETGIFFDSTKDAAIAYNLKRTTLVARLSGQNINTTNLVYA